MANGEWKQPRGAYSQDLPCIEGPHDVLVVEDNRPIPAILVPSPLLLSRDPHKLRTIACWTNPAVARPRSKADWTDSMIPE